MPKNFYLDPDTNDFVLKSLNLRMTETVTEHLSQKVTNNLATFLGEWFLDEDLGLPYYQDILKKQPDLDVINAIYRNAIEDIDGIIELVTFNSELDTGTREFTYTFQAEGENTDDLVEGGN